MASSTPLVTAAADAAAATASAAKPAAAYYPPSAAAAAAKGKAEKPLAVARTQPANQLIRNLKYHDSAAAGTGGGRVSAPTTPKPAAAAAAAALDPESAFAADAEPVPAAAAAAAAAAARGRKGSHAKKVQITGHDYHSLDIYLPTFADDGKVPVLIHVHGGGWQRGDRASEWRGAPIMGRTGSAHGFIVVVVSYRLAPPTLGVILMRAIVLGFLLSLLLLTVPAASLPLFGAADSAEHVVARRWGLIGIVWACVSSCVAALLWWKTAHDVSKARHPHQVTDVARAIAWVQKHLQTYAPAADLDAVFVSGHSAGAHLASLVTLDTSYMARAGVRDADRFVKGCIPMSGIYTVSHPMRCRLTSAMFRFVYAESAFGNDPEVWRNASPITHVRAGIAMPLCVMNAATDVGLDNDGRAFVAKLKECGVPHEYHVIPWTDHASIAARFDKNQAHALYFDFVRRRVAQLRGVVTAAADVTAPTPAADGSGVSARVVSAGAVAALTDVDIKLDAPNGTGAAAGNGHSNV